MRPADNYTGLKNCYKRIKLASQSRLGSHAELSEAWVIRNNT